MLGQLTMFLVLLFFGLVWSCPLDGPTSEIEKCGIVVWPYPEEFLYPMRNYIISWHQNLSTSESSKCEFLYKRSEEIRIKCPPMLCNSETESCSSYRPPDKPTALRILKENPDAIHYYRKYQHYHWTVNQETRDLINLLWSKLNPGAHWEDLIDLMPWAP